MEVTLSRFSSHSTTPPNSVTNPNLPLTTKSRSLPRPRHSQRYPPRAIRSSALEQCIGLKPRPTLRPIVPTLEAETAPEPVRDAKPVPLALCSQIEKLVLFNRYEEALELFDFLGSKNFQGALGIGTYNLLVTACIGLGSVHYSKMVFHHMLDTGFKFDLYMRNRVLFMYVKCGRMCDARYLFEGMPSRNAVSWNIIITGLVEVGDYEEALDMFMVMWEEVLDVGTRILAAGIRAATGVSMVGFGRQMHAAAVKLDVYDDVYVSCALINMYCKCECVREGHWVFDEMPEKTVVAWNTIIAGYALNGYSEEALGLYCEMIRMGVRVDHFTYSIIFRLCARLASVDHAKQAHASLVRNGFGKDVVAITALVDLYCKWGRMEDARNIFEKMPQKNIISWNALIGGYAIHGKGKEAVKMFEKLRKEGLVPNHVTFLAVLTACSYSGLIDKGWKLFQAMTNDYKIKPRAMHYACMVELLGREGLLDDALALIEEAPFIPTANMWGALLTACRIHLNVELAKLAAEKLAQLEAGKVGSYVVLLNIYGCLGKLNEAASILETLKSRGVRFFPACSFIEIGKNPHCLTFRDRSHPQTDQIYAKLDELMIEVAKLGYTSGGQTFLSDVGEHEEMVPKYHSERLAIAFGLINTSRTSSLQVVQSHRICSDCHEVIKLFSVVTRRDLVVRDSSRFHHFRKGICSCGDYW